MEAELEACDQRVATGDGALVNQLLSNWHPRSTHNVLALAKQALIFANQALALVRLVLKLVNKAFVNQVLALVKRVLRNALPGSQALVKYASQIWLNNVLVHEALPNQGLVTYHSTDRLSCTSSSILPLTALPISGLQEATS